MIADVNDESIDNHAGSAIIGVENSYDLRESFNDVGMMNSNILANPELEEGDEEME